MAAVYVFGGILAVLLVSVVASPLIERRRFGGGDEGPLTPEQRKERALEALRELEFDFETGKILEDDYVELRRRWAEEAIAARDALGEEHEAPAGHCPVCGAELRPGAKFCSRCGAATGAAAAAGETVDG